MRKATMLSRMHTPSLLNPSPFTLPKRLPYLLLPLGLFFVITRFVGSRPPVEAYLREDLAAEFHVEEDPHMDLRLVQVVVRHGDRTPIHLLPPPNDNLSWECETEETSGVSLPGARVRPQSLTQMVFVRDQQTLRGSCHLGQLTSMGIQQLMRVGLGLRRRYVDQLGFLPKKFHSHDVFIRSTDYSRTRQSVQSLLSTLYPPETRESLIPIHTHEAKVENMYPNPVRCPRFPERRKELYTRQRYLDKQKDMEGLKREVARRLQVELADVPPWDALYDVVHARVAHDRPLPGSMDDEVVRRICDQASWEITYLYADTQIQRITIGSFLGELLQHMTDIEKGHRGEIFRVYQGHDTTLSSLLSALQVFDGTWPPYASSVLLELAQKRRDASLHLRVIYNGHVLPFPFSPSSATNGYCPLHIVLERVRHLIPNDAGLQEECQARGSSA